ncbi:MAG: hypothetical protein KC766_03530, partial [Myxococcales bacterium]|nr:hypothetical protein [Myxococcales bacterium]
MSKIPPYDLILEPLEALDRIEEWLRKKRVELEGPGDDAFARYQQGEDVDPHAPGFVESKAKFHARQAVGQVGQHVPGLKKFYPWNSDTTRELLTD